MANIDLQKDKTNVAGELPRVAPVRQLLFFGIGWLGLSVIALLVSLVVRQILASIYPDPLAFEIALQHISYSATVNIVSYVILLVTMLLIAWTVIKPLINTFIRPSTIFKGLGYGGLILLSGIVINTLYLVFGINLSDNANETTITLIMRTYPFLSVIAFVIAGPICEELTYRLGLFSLVRRINRYLAYAVTFIFFGLIHFDFSTTNLVNELLNLPFYVVAGLIFCYIYEKEGLAMSIYAHVTNNLISFIATFIASDVLVRFI